MATDVVIRTIVPILLLVGAGFFSRKMKFLKSGDERVLSAYVYYFALPALFFVNMVETNFVEEETLRFMVAGIIPVLVVLTIYLSLYLIFRFPRNTLYLLILSTIFGSLAFFGIPFITFAFPPPAEGEYLATLSAATIAIISVTISITILELYRLEQSTVWKGLKHVVKRLSRNPLVISILSGILLSVTGIEIPSPVSTSLHMLGGTTSAVAIFMLGVFLYGRKYTNLVEAFGLSLLRIVFLPIVALLTTVLFNLFDVERSVLVLMHGMPVAISMIILSERYDFYKETIASLILISSLGAGLYLNLWLTVVGYY
ncbi:MAG: AEC family transporter [Candidatus Bathyarchaeota archaeon]|nr:AEC family transporter [Candidatus Bathyarchaeota archaeon]MDH5732253.1 AEC family transporter [Candidatus Bathyarchaeota archaeon]